MTTALRQALGDDAVRDGEAVWRLSAAGAVPVCVIEPTDVDQVVAAVGAAARHQLAVLPAGNGTHLGIGWPPASPAAALSTRRLARILAHDAGDMTVRVQAGVTIEALNAALAAAGQWLPLDPPRAQAMTVGGMIAADRNGPLRLGYGGIRDWLIGVRAVMADGMLVRGGGQVVKNVAGYDLPRLFAGSFGTLGVIVEATFKVRPQVAGMALCEWTAPSLADALARARAVLGSDVQPVLLEAVNESAAEALGLDSGASLLIGCAGSPAHLDEQAARIAALSDGAAARHASERGDALLRALREFSQPADEDALVIRLSVLPTALGPLVAEIEAAAATARVVAEIAAHAGNGVAWCQLLGAPDEAALIGVAEAARAAARRQGGWAVFESMPAELRGRLDPWGFDAPALAIMRRVKAALDPSGLFSPGRFVGAL
ncbi:MAG TPA: FAD-binding oxidoreductase [Candidatus Dormibacteraeota bacterium]|nr:FAD-binding oxidoreductase [Candidatus Dormibacteraeota bacterium]